MRKLTLSLSTLVILLLVGCQDTMVSPDVESTETFQSQAVAKVQFGGVIWADGELFRTLGTPTSFDGDQGNFDILFTGSFLDDVGAISDSKPGDRDYNGGRWAVYALKDGVVTDYSGASSVDDLNPDDFEPTGDYFECPLRPQRGQGPK